MLPAASGLLLLLLLFVTVSDASAVPLRLPAAAAGGSCKTIIRHTHACTRVQTQWCTTQQCPTQAASVSHIYMSAANEHKMCA